MLYTIRTCYIPPTDSSGARIRATGAINANVVSATIPYPYELSGEAAHWSAASNLLSLSDVEWKDHAVIAMNLRGFVFSSED